MRPQTPQLFSATAGDAQVSLRWSKNAAGLYLAFLYANGQMMDLGTLGSYSFGSGINNSGQVVGSYISNADDRRHAFL